jgi:hypothetical protein
MEISWLVTVYSFPRTAMKSVEAQTIELRKSGKTYDKITTQLRTDRPAQTLLKAISCILPLDQTPQYDFQSRGRCTYAERALFAQQDHRDSHPR